MESAIVNNLRRDHNMSGRRWDWHMNDTQKAVMRCMTDDDRVSLSTLTHRLGTSVTLVYMRCLKNRGLVEQPTPRTFVYQLTRKGRLVAREARQELDRSYETVRAPTPMIEGQRRKAKAKRELYMPRLASLLGSEPAKLAAYLQHGSPLDRRGGGT